MRNWSIVTKTVISAFGIVFVLLTLGGVVFVKYEAGLNEMFRDEFQKKIDLSVEDRILELEKNLREKIISNATILTGICGIYLTDDDPARLKHALDTYMSRLEIQAVKILNKNGESFAAVWRSPNVTHGKLFPDTLRLNENLSVETDAIHEGEKVGSITIYYTDSVLANQLWLIRGKATTDSERFYNMLYSRLKQAIIKLGAGCFIILVIQMLFLMLFLRILILRPVKMLSDITHRLADFDLTVTVDTTRKDEIGKLFAAVRNMVSELRKIVEEVKSGGKRLAGASHEVDENISVIASAIEKISDNIRSVSGTTEQMSMNNHSVAGAIEEMSVSISEVGNNARRGSRITEEAVAVTEKAGDRMTALEKAASRIGEVTEMIKKIADRTHLLALNAHIEAASAGAAGKGFSVVANEIKTFASQITQAADDIAMRISLMQENTEHAIAGIDSVSDVILKLRTSSEMISFALEEQMKAVEEIATHAAQANTRADDIAVSMEELAHGANKVSMTVGMAARGDDEVTEDKADVPHINTSAAQVAKLAKALLALVEKFKI